MMTTYLFKNDELFLIDAEEKRDRVTCSGIYTGHTGIAIVYYLLAKAFGNKSFAEKGLYLLEWVSESGISKDNVGFSDGLAGIGWAIEWLAQNELMEDVDTDDILEPVDRLLYKAVSYDRDDNPTLASGTLGKIVYFAKRAARHNINTNRFKTIGHLECLVLLLDDLADKAKEIITVPGGQPKTGKSEWNPEVRLSDLGEMLVYVTNLKVKVNSPTTGNIIYGSVNAAERILSKSAIYAGNCLDYLYLAICYLIAAKNRDNIYWEAQAVQHIERIVDMVDNQCLLTTEQLFKKLVIYSLLHLQIPTQAYLKEVKQLLTTLSSLEIPPTLVNGRGTLVVAELCLSNPRLIEYWQEVLFFSFK